MELIAQIALGVIIGGLTIALFVTGFFVWNSRKRNERLAAGLFIAGAVMIAVLVAVVVNHKLHMPLYWLCYRHNNSMS